MLGQGRRRAGGHDPLAEYVPSIQQILRQIRADRAGKIDLRYEMHVLLIEHGRKTCGAINPRCGKCALLELCAYRRSRVG